MTEIKSCPFCGQPPQWLRKESSRSAEGEAPMRALGCSNVKCAVMPQTKWRNTEEWKQGEGYYGVDYDRQALANWNRRT